MANLLSSFAKEQLAALWLSNDMRVVLLDSGYVYSAAHDNLDDVGAGTRVVTSGALASKTAAGGVLDAADVTFLALSGDVITQGWIYKHTGTESTSTLWIYFNQATGNPFTPVGTTLVLQWDNGATKIASL